MSEINHMLKSFDNALGLSDNAMKLTDNEITYYLACQQIQLFSCQSQEYVLTASLTGTVLNFADTLPDYHLYHQAHQDLFPQGAQRMRNVHVAELQGLDS